MRWPSGFVVLVLLTIIILSYTLQRVEIKFKIYGNFRNQLEAAWAATGVSSTIRPTKDGILYHLEMEWSKKEKEIENILQELDEMIPNITFRDIKTVTSAKNSQATIVNRQDTYCVGDHLAVRLDLYDHVGKRKEHGGDFLRARIYSQNLEAGASGLVQDHRNGTYLVDFTLFWEGNVSISLLLIHPSEAVSALWRARKKGYDKIAFTGKFLNGISTVNTECGFKLNRRQELCAYLDERDQEAFYCVKPKNVPCEAFVQLKTHNTPISYLTGMEQSLLRRPNLGVEIPWAFKDIHVVPCNGTKTAKETCRVGMASPVPSGYVLHNVWHPGFCSVTDFSTLAKIQTCLKKKMVYLMGDSTSFQWVTSLLKRVTTLRYFDTHPDAPAFNTRVAVDLERNTFIQWKKHGHPIVTLAFYSVKDLDYVAREIDRVAGDSDTAVILALGQHFRPFPIDIFVRRAVNIRNAVERLLLRSPDTKVIVKAENIREMRGDMERFGDFHGYMQKLAMQRIFRSLKVGMIDAWDMTVAYNTDNVHPPEDVVWNQIVMFLTYFC
uniref:NXPE family member 2-like isoform X2 n=1 Tax=Pogona vitticeps TaxID=103695 RepID=A0ABM5EQM8_9SAUR